MLRRCPKALHDNCNSINHIGVIYSQYPFGDTLDPCGGAFSGDSCCIETSQQIWIASLLVGLYMMRASYRECLRKDIGHKLHLYD